MNKRQFSKLQKAVTAAMDSEQGKQFIVESIQAMAEGGSDPVSIESLLTGTRVSGGIDGLLNTYRTWESQVTETYRKYNNQSDWGNTQVRAIVDIRTSFICGEGLSVACEKPKTAKWLEGFIDDNKLDGTFLLDTVKFSEMGGKVLLYLLPIIDKDGSKKIAVKKHGTNGGSYTYEIKDGKATTYRNKNSNDEKEQKKRVVSKDWFQVVTGGDATRLEGPTTKVGLVLNDCENYDRAVKDMRRLNHVLARITPTVKTQNESLAGKVRAIMNRINWKIGQAFVSSAEFKYETPNTGAHDNLTNEMAVNIKNISAVTGIPVHWIGWVDLMSNRSTAETLYETINNATAYERLALSEVFKDLLVDAQRLYIDNGGKEINEVNRDFQVRIPIIDFSHFLEKVRAWSIAFNDGVISADDYMNAIPSIDPLATKRVLAANKKAEEKEAIRKSKIVEADESEESDNDKDNKDQE